MNDERPRSFRDEALELVEELIRDANELAARCPYPTSDSFKLDDMIFRANLLKLKITKEEDNE